MNYQFNLQPWRELEKQKKQKKFIAVSVIVFLGLILLLGLNYFIENKFIEEQDRTKQHLENEIASLGAAKKKVEETKLLIEEINKQVVSIEQLQMERSVAIRLLTELAEKMPDSVFLDTLKLEDNILTMSGVAETDQGISSLLRVLESNPLLIPASIDDVQYQTAQSTGRYEIPPASESKSFTVIVRLNDTYGELQ